jgi:hypothetical protein
LDLGAIVLSRYVIVNWPLLFGLPAVCVEL